MLSCSCDMRKLGTEVQLYAVSNWVRGFDRLSPRGEITAKGV